MTTYRVLFSGKDPIGHINFMGDRRNFGRDKGIHSRRAVLPPTFFQNCSGQVVIWELNGTSIIIGGGNVADPGPAWHV